MAPGEVVSLYRDERKSACEIAAMSGLTRMGIERKLRADGIQGVQWCPVHRIHEASFSGSYE